MRIVTAFIFGLVLFAASAFAGADSSANLIDGFEAVRPWRPLSGMPTPVLSLQKKGVVGKALKIQFPKSEEPQFAGRIIEGDSSWDQADGISLRFRGDGSDGFITLSLIDDTLTKRYATLISLRSKKWQRMYFKWSDFIPEVITANWMSVSADDMKPSLIRAAWFGRWYYLRPWNACHFEIDELRLETQIERPEIKQAAQSGLTRTLAKLKKGQPVTLVAIGDSVTYGTNLKNRKQDAYPAVLERMLRKRFKNKDIKVFNKGIGGIETRQGMVLIPRDVVPLKPDLILVHYGYNDFSSMQGKPMKEAQREQLAQRNFSELIQRLRIATRSEADVLVIATIPGANSARRYALDVFGAAGEKAAAALSCEFTAEPQKAFQRSWSKGKIEKLFARLPNGRVDVAHPNEKGHKLFAENLIKLFE